MSTIYFWVLVGIGACFLIAATAAAVRAVRRGESVWATFKSWVVKVVDALSGIG